MYISILSRFDSCGGFTMVHGDLRYDLRVECYHQLPLWVILRVAGLNPYQSTPSVDGFASATSATAVKVRFLTSIIPVDQLGSSCAQV